MKRSRAFLFVTLAISAAFSVTTHLRAANFQGIGDFWPQDVSADGSTIVGFVPGNSDLAVRWTSEDGLTELGDLPGGVTSSAAFGVSGDGSVIVGWGYSEAGQEAFRWESGSGMTGLGDLPGDSHTSSANDVSADGSTIVGMSVSANGWEAFRWTEAEGMVGIGDLPGSSFFSAAEDVSSDGSTLTGYGSETEPNFDAFRWSAGDGMEPIIPRAGLAAHGSTALGISDDGSTIVGQVVTAAESVRAYRWTAEQGLDVLIEDHSSWALAVSGDGSAVVGTSQGEAFLWTDADGARRLADVLTLDWGLDLTGWTLTEATGISSDGRVIVGNGSQGGWMAVIPEPGACSLLYLGFVGFISGTRRRRH